jgi:hypothetical protein
MLSAAASRSISRCWPGFSTENYRAQQMDLLHRVGIPISACQNDHAVVRAANCQDSK